MSRQERSFTMFAEDVITITGCRAAIDDDTKTLLLGGSKAINAVGLTMCVTAVQHLVMLCVRMCESQRVRLLYHPCKASYGVDFGNVEKPSTGGDGTGAFVTGQRRACKQFKSHRA